MTILEAFSVIQSNVF